MSVLDAKMLDRFAVSGSVAEILHTAAAHLEAALGDAVSCAGANASPLSAQREARRRAHRFARLVAQWFPAVEGGATTDEWTPGVAAIGVTRMVVATVQVGRDAPFEVTCMSQASVDVLREAFARIADDPDVRVTATTHPGPPTYELAGADARWLVCAAHGIAAELAGLPEAQEGAALPVVKRVHQNATALRHAVQRLLPVGQA